jgi:epoxyqueuosine reductase QueG
VCPWNGEKFVQITREPDFSSGWTPGGVQPGSAPSTDAPALIELMGMDEAAWDRFS